jgi:hypothetical protein
LIDMELLPNLGAEEGNDWRAYLHEPHARVAARLWSHLFSRNARFRYPAESAKDSWRSSNCEEGWPAGLGRPPEEPVFAWLEESDRPTAWLNTRSLEETAHKALGETLCGPPANRVAATHDKAFAVETGRELGLIPRSLAPLIRIIDAEALRSPDTLIEELDAALREWPDWSAGRFTLKPRHGSSGRGRVGGRGTVDTEAVRGALSRFAGRGGAIFEPWLARRKDLSVALHIAGPQSRQSLPTVLGSLEMLVTPSGVFRGHCGEVDSRGRVFSGHPNDETLRADAAAVANRARELGFFGPCGIDAFSYMESDRERFRGLVEFNARATMGLVTIGLVRRALPRVREALELTPGTRRAFVFGFISPAERRDEERLIDSMGPNAMSIDLGQSSAEADPRPFLVFARDHETLGRMHLEILGC